MCSRSPTEERERENLFVRVFLTFNIHNPVCVSFLFIILRNKSELACGMIQRNVVTLLRVKNLIFFYKLKKHFDTFPLNLVTKVFELNLIKNFTVFPGIRRISGISKCYAIEISLSCSFNFKSETRTPYGIFFCDKKKENLIIHQENKLSEIQNTEIFVKTHGTDCGE